MNKSKNYLESEEYMTENMLGYLSLRGYGQINELEVELRGFYQASLHIRLSYHQYTHHHGQKEDLYINLSRNSSIVKQYHALLGYQCLGELRPTSREALLLYP